MFNNNVIPAIHTMGVKLWRLTPMRDVIVFIIKIMYPFFAQKMNILKKG